MVVFVLFGLVDEVIVLYGICLFCWVVVDMVDIVFIVIVFEYGGYECGVVYDVCIVIVD